jgi:hypothetical protein
VLHPTRDRELNGLYARLPARVGYVDETFDLGAKPLYVMSAVIVDGEALNDARDDLLEIVGTDYWHSSSALASKDADLIARLEGLVQYLADSDIVTLCTVDTDPSHFASVEQVRSYTLYSLASALRARYSVDLMVMERRRPGAEEEADSRTVHRIQSSPDLRDLRVHQGTPSSEPLLWAPDVVAATLRRRIARDQAQWYEPIREKTTLLRAGSFEPIILQKKDNP